MHDADSRADSSSFDADSDGWRENYPSRSIVAAVPSLDSGHGGELDEYNGLSHGRDKGRAYPLPTRTSQGDRDSDGDRPQATHSSDSIRDLGDRTGPRREEERSSNSHSAVHTASDGTVNFQVPKYGVISHYDTASDEDVSLFDLAR